eukprot:CAMPEP_0175049230 /NCGR_PEP_ID=MMETSP0052_2-20121109/6622_1 /TAXON_ID=51329 ORGANISM="Polytomella parva, Strain SAG 63-3" /NCGR_SAMPLE_ID=MMETSP0052_2 /ASSEMBLY_ACC=CAM_ASM_000194 /LENGTH=809 /DNA_ID=CAMNT_0016313367 /DNA_START=525 /DNA_END=2951 /DNA_ORIENTATION=+
MPLGLFLTGLVGGAGNLMGNMDGLAICDKLRNRLFISVGEIMGRIDDTKVNRESNKEEMENASCGQCSVQEKSFSSYLTDKPKDTLLNVENVADSECDFDSMSDANTTDDDYEEEDDLSQRSFLRIRGLDFQSWNRWRNPEALNKEGMVDDNVASNGSSKWTNGWTVNIPYPNLSDSAAGKSLSAAASAWSGQIQALREAALQRLKDHRSRGFCYEKKGSDLSENLHSKRSNGGENGVGSNSASHMASGNTGFNVKNFEGQFESSFCEKSNYFPSFSASTASQDGESYSPINHLRRLRSAVEGLRPPSVSASASSVAAAARAAASSFASTAAAAANAASNHLSGSSVKFSSPSLRLRLRFANATTSGAPSPESNLRETNANIADAMVDENDEKISIINIPVPSFSPISVEPSLSSELERVVGESIARAVVVDENAQKEEAKKKRKKRGGRDARAMGGDNVRFLLNGDHGSGSGGTCCGGASYGGMNGGQWRSMADQMRYQRRAVSPTLLDRSAARSVLAGRCLSTSARRSGSHFSIPQGDVNGSHIPRQSSSRKKRNGRNKGAISDINRLSQTSLNDTCSHRMLPTHATAATNVSVMTTTSPAEDHVDAMSTSLDLNSNASPFTMMVNESSEKDPSSSAPFPLIKMLMNTTTKTLVTLSAATSTSANVAAQNSISSVSEPKKKIAYPESTARAINSYSSSRPSRRPAKALPDSCTANPDLRPFLTPSDAVEVSYVAMLSDLTNLAYHLGDVTHDFLQKQHGLRLIATSLAEVPNGSSAPSPHFVSTPPVSVDGGWRRHQKAEGLLAMGE